MSRWMKLVAAYIARTVNRPRYPIRTCLLAYSMEQSPFWEANWSGHSQEIPRILWNPEGSSPHSQAHATCPYPEPAPSSPHTHFPKIHPNIILPSTPGSPQWSPSLRFPHQNPVHTSPLPHTRCMPAHLILLAQYCVRSTDYSAPHYVIFSIPVLPRPS